MSDKHQMKNTSVIYWKPIDDLLIAKDLTNIPLPEATYTKTLPGMSYDI